MRFTHFHSYRGIWPNRQCSTPIKACQVWGLFLHGDFGGEFQGMRFFSITLRIHGTGIFRAFRTVFLPTWMVAFYGFRVAKYLPVPWILRDMMLQYFIFFLYAINLYDQGLKFHLWHETLPSWIRWEDFQIEHDRNEGKTHRCLLALSSIW